MFQFKKFIDDALSFNMLPCFITSFDIENRLSPPENNKEQDLGAARRILGDVLVVCQLRLGVGSHHPMWGDRHQRRYLIAVCLRSVIYNMYRVCPDSLRG